jgi:hypothetical protein
MLIIFLSLIYSVKPTQTLPAAAYAACTDYASILHSCASATSSFYALPASQQISCACYTPATAATECSISTSPTPDPTYSSYGKQRIAFSTQAIDRFDDAGNYCRDYFAQQGYTNLASALSGNGSSGDPVLGAAFCANVGQKFGETATRTQARYGLQTEANGLPLRLEATAFGACETVLVMRHSGGGVRNFGAERVVLVIMLVVYILFA